MVVLNISGARAILIPFFVFTNKFLEEEFQIKDTGGLLNDHGKRTLVLVRDLDTPCCNKWGLGWALG